MKNTESTENYLKSIFKLQTVDNKVSTTDLAKYMGVRAASVTGMLKKLAKMKLVTYQPYKGAALTSAGRKLALKTLRTHRLIELFLVEHLGLPWEEVHGEAEKWEHVISGRIEEKIDQLLGHPLHDPHGSPIPSANGKLKTRVTTRLDQMKEGESGIIGEVPDEDPEFLAYLGEYNIIPGNEIKVLEKSVVGKTLKIKVKNKKHTIGFTAAEKIRVYRPKNKGKGKK
jgi:DtxR family Mn-dependent transcriptional regulator